MSQECLVEKALAHRSTIRNPIQPFRNHAPSRDFWERLLANWFAEFKSCRSLIGPKLHCESVQLSHTVFTFEAV